jgi:hypothetical protein
MSEITHITLTENDWDDSFEPITNPRTSSDAEPSYAFNPNNPIDLDYLAGVEIANLWSHVDSESRDGTVIVNGIYRINFIQYFVTKKPAPSNQRITVIV